MKFDKASLAKSSMPKKGPADPMLDSSDLEHEASMEGESVPEESAEQPVETELSKLSDDELLEELKKRGFEIEDDSAASGEAVPVTGTK